MQATLLSNAPTYEVITQLRMDGKVGTITVIRPIQSSDILGIPKSK